MAAFVCVTAGLLAVATDASPALAANSAARGVTHLAARPVTSSTVRLAWQWPSAKAVVDVTVRVAVGSAAPTSASKGRLGGRAVRPDHALTVRGLRPHTRYAFAVFAKARHGGYGKPATLRVTTKPAPPLKIVTRSLDTGVRGLAYLQLLSATGGFGGYSWSATGLPAGLAISRRGVISGYPRATGTRLVTLRIRDGQHVVSQRRLSLSVPTSLPAGCVARSCAQLSRNGHTLQIPRGDIVALAKSRRTGKVTTVRLNGVSVAKGDILVLAPHATIRSGLIALAVSVSKHGGVSTVGVRPTTPAAAYYQGIVQAIGKPSPSAAADRRNVAPAADLSCNGKVRADLHGLTVTPSLTPTLAVDWKHRLFGGKGIYAGFGGLKLFQFGLTGTIKVDLGVSVSAKATCNLDLPGIDELIPAGDLGAVLVQLDPSLTLMTTGQAEVRTSVTLSCTAEFTWRQGKENRADFCTSSYEPLRLSAESGVDATVTGTIDASASLDDLPGVKGTIEASLHAGYHPEQQPIAEIDAKADYDLKATLANVWKDAPSLTIVKGTLFDRTLATYGSRPQPPEPPGPPSISVTPALAGPWNSAVCGFDNPDNPPNRFNINGTDFQPGEPVRFSTGWKTYPGRHIANPDGNFSVTKFVGQVPSVLDEYFDVFAAGGSGSSATTSIELNSNGCIHQIHDNNGSVKLRWGGNGEDPDSTVELSINSDTISSGTTNNLGSGGSTATFTCPSSGTYTWSVSSTVNGEPVNATSSFDCVPAGGNAGAGSGRVNSWAPAKAS